MFIILVKLSTVLNATNMHICESSVLLLASYLCMCVCTCVQGPESNRTSQSTTVVFNGSKKEQFTPTSGFKSLHRKLKTNWKVAV